MLRTAAIETCKHLTTLMLFCHISVQVKYHSDLISKKDFTGMLWGGRLLCKKLRVEQEKLESFFEILRSIQIKLFQMRNNDCLLNRYSAILWILLTRILWKYPTSRWATFWKKVGNLLPSCMAILWATFAALFRPLPLGHNLKVSGSLKISWSSLPSDGIISGVSLCGKFSNTG